jgi:3-mercaptopyruvate sulfurtransferase SseA
VRDDGTFKSADELRELWTEWGNLVDVPIEKGS